MDYQIDDAENQESGEKEDERPKEDVPQAAEVAGKTEHDTQQVEQSDKARDTAGKSNDQKEVWLKKCLGKYMNHI